MAEQPQNMLQLIRSVEETLRHPATKVVVPTIASHDFVQLSTAQRGLLNSYLQQSQADAMAISAAAPGATLEARQTDQWYRTHDQNGAFARLSTIAQTVGLRNR